MSFPKVFPWPRLFEEAEGTDAVPFVSSEPLVAGDCVDAASGLFCEDDSCSAVAEAPRAPSDMLRLAVETAPDAWFAPAGPEATVVAGPAATVRALAAAIAKTPPLTTTARLMFNMLGHSLRYAGYGWHNPDAGRRQASVMKWKRRRECPAEMPDDP
jgi:hypothetical protein